jgi:uncharacterized protein YkwD
MRALVLWVMLALLALTVAGPAKATHTVWLRCDALVDRVNAYRATDLRLYSRLCNVAHDRARQMAAQRRIWHDLRPVIRALASSGICWRSVGEVTAWNTYSVRAFVDQWHRSAAHWHLLMGPYDTAGGSWTTSDGRHYAVMYVVDRC